MKFSLLFLTLILVWSGLATNGWMLQTRYNDLKKELEELESRTDRISIRYVAPEIVVDTQKLESELPPFRKLHDKIVDAIESDAFEKIDLESIGGEFASVAEIPRVSHGNPINFRASKFKIRIPEGRTVVLSAVFSVLPDETKSETKELALPTGEYMLELWYDKNMVPFTKIRTTGNSRHTSTGHRMTGLDVHIIVNDRQPMVWEFPVDDYLNNRSGRNGLQKPTRLESGQRSKALLEERFENTSTKYSVSARIHLADRTDNE